MTSATPNLEASLPGDEHPSRRERRRREIHDRIIEAATELFGRKGFSGTTALEIAENADVAEKTFYNHFPTKQHLIEELAGRTLGRMGSLLAEGHRFPGTAADRLRHFCDHAAAFAEAASRDLTREVVMEIVRVSQVDGRSTEWNRQLQEVMRTILRDGRANGDAACEQELEVQGELAIAAFLGLFIHWVTLPDYPLRDRLRQLATRVVESREPRSPLGSEPDPR
jgi:AcrR family transcriptional regulator